MAEYIDREALLKAMSYHNYYPKGKHFLKGIETAEEIIEHFPAADVQPVKHGRWGGKFPVSRCSVCDATMILGDYGNYCPNCGADMRETNDEKA